MSFGKFPKVLIFWQVTTSLQLGATFWPQKWLSCAPGSSSSIMMMAHGEKHWNPGRTKQTHKCSACTYINGLLVWGRGLKKFAHPPSPLLPILGSALMKDNSKYFNQKQFLKWGIRCRHDNIRFICDRTIGRLDGRIWWCASKKGGG